MSTSRQSGYKTRMGLGTQTAFSTLEPIVDISDELARRVPSAPDYLREKLALQDLALQMAENPELVLPRLVELAKLSCGADSAGISLFEPEGDVFRWHHLSGVLAQFSGATTPRRFSPCGVCLDRHAPVLMKNPEAIYGWIADAQIVVPVVLLVPLYIGTQEPLGTLWIVARPGMGFDAGHVRAITEFAGFAGLALKMIRIEDTLKRALDDQETLTKEMSHRVKNVFAIADGMIRISSRTAETPRQMAEDLSARMHALATAHSLARRQLGDNQIGTTDIAALVRAILQPHQAENNATLRGEPIALGERTTTGLALVFHELATNSAKYGALSESGAVNVTWQTLGELVRVEWKETGGPAVASQPTKKGFGTVLSERTIVSQFGGTIEYDWKPEGVQVVMTMPLAKLMA